jgi:hypothetical protein
MCCGKTTRTRSVSVPSSMPLRAAVQSKGVRHGAPAMYVGASVRDAVGSVSGYKYRLSPLSRRLQIDPRDLSALVRDFDVVLMP